MTLSPLILILAACAGTSTASIARSPTPPMGWNSYNTYSCSPSEEAIKISAQGLVDIGLADLGYSFVTVDCGWPSRDRDVDGRLQWNKTLFPSGGKALGDYIHDLGLGFGLYSGGGYLQCGSEDIPASLGYEEVDAQSFAEWGGDSLKYDNCYATSTDVMVDSESDDAQSPARFQTMAGFLEAVDREIAYFICQWGIGENVPEWAKEIGNTWRISNDIYNAWRSIWRITNQVFSHAKHTATGMFADMDMLIVGLGALSLEEERFHFGMWAIFKSPLIIGTSVSTDHTSQESLDILANEAVIAINQDPLSKPAHLARRYTEEEYDILTGELSGDRLVVGIANWKNESQNIELDLSSVGVQSANAHNVWAASDLGLLSGIEEFDLKGHELMLLVLSDISPSDDPLTSGYYSAADASLQGSAATEVCEDGCEPTGAKVIQIAANSSVTFSSVSAAEGGTKIVAVDYINYDYAFTTAWDLGSNIRNMTIVVNGGVPKRWAFPLSGGDWYETGRMLVEVDGFAEGDENEIVFSGFANSGFAPDLVGFEIFDESGALTNATAG